MGVERREKIPSLREAEELGVIFKIQRPREEDGEEDTRTIILVAIKLPAALLQGIDQYKKAYKHGSRSEVIRLAIVKLLRESIWRMGSGHE